jgi:hypothetical protein
MIRTPQGTAAVPRWTARVLSLLILGFWGFFIVAHIFGNAEPAPRPLGVVDYLGFLCMGMWLGGLVIAWKSELLGGLVALAGIGTFAFFNPRVLSFPGTLVPIDAILFLVSAWLHRWGSSGWMEGGPALDS